MELNFLFFFLNSYFTTTKKNLEKKMSSNHGQLKRDYIGNTLTINNKLVVDRQTNICGKNAKFTGDVKIKGDLCVGGVLDCDVAGKFDVIIAGVGTAGCIAFRRISDGDPTLSVLGLVTGEYNNENPKSKYPFAPDPQSLNLPNAYVIFGGGQPELNDTVINYNFMGPPVLEKQTTNIYGGRGLGGCSMHNTLYGERASPGFHNYASTFAGPYAAQWNGAACNTIYQAMETYLGPPAQPNRGYAGPFRILQQPLPSNPPYGDALGDVINSVTATSLSPADNALSITFDYNNNVDLAVTKSGQNYLYPDPDSPIGVSRSSTAEAYLGPDFLTPQGFSAIGRNNRVLFQAIVNRVLFDADNNAIGVEVFVNNKRQVYLANKKVIICAGGIRSPGILERSGIGQGSLLSNLGITQIVENPNVGENYSNHSAPFALFQVAATAFSPEYSTNLLLQSYPTSPYPFQRQMEYGFAGAAGLAPLYGLFGGPSMLIQSLGIDTTRAYAGYLPILQPTSRGSIHIQDTSVDAQPNFIWNMDTTANDIFMKRNTYQHWKRVEADLAINHPTMGFEVKLPTSAQYAGYPSAPTIVFTASIAGTVMTVTAVASGTLSETMSVLEGAVWSSAPASIVQQGTYVLSQLTGAPGGIGTYSINLSQTVGSMSMHGDYLDQAAATINVVQGHNCGTCKMGDRVTQQGVVDGQLHVYGVQKLMVADNSIWPVVADAHTHMTAMIAGYKAADFCLATI